MDKRATLLADLEARRVRKLRDAALAVLKGQDSRVIAQQKRRQREWMAKARTL